MPNMKLYVEKSLPASSFEAIEGQLAGLRTLLMDRLSVTAAACQIAIIPVGGLPDQPMINVELHILPNANRTRELLTALADDMRVFLGRVPDVQIAVRISHLDPATYVAVK